MSSFLVFFLMVLCLSWCVHICHRVLVGRHLHTVVSTESSSCSGEGTWPVFTSVSVVVVHRQWACILSSHGCGCLSNANAITALLLVFSFLQGETRNEVICFDTCAVYVGMPGPRVHVQHPVLGCFCSKDGCMDMFAPAMVVIFVGWLGNSVWKQDVCSGSDSRAQGIS